MKSLAKRVIKGLFSERLSVDRWLPVTTLWELYLERIQTSMEFPLFLEGLNAFHDKVEVVERNELVCRLIDQRFCRGRLRDCIGDLSDEILADLAKVVAEEDWHIPGKSDDPYALLKNYLFQIFKRAYDENKLFVSDRFLIFNTGLYDKSRRNVYYGLLEKREEGDGAPYSFYAWRPEKHIPEWEGVLPASVDFLEMLSPYNPNHQHTVDYEHIAISNRRRLDFLNVPNSDAEGRELLLSLLEGCVQASFRRAKARDFKAIPTYFTSQNRVEKVQYLIPLYYDNKPKAALVLNIKKDRYDIETVLTLEMAYQNARVINNINQTWIKEVFSSSKEGVKEETKRVQALLNDAEGGRADAWLQLARMYDTGDGVSINLERAFSCYRNAAKAGVIKAFRYLGECYLHGRGVVRDEYLAKRAFVEGAINDDVDCQYELAKILLQTPHTKRHQQAVIWADKAAEQGHLKAAELLGECYLNGWGIKKDRQKGVVYLEKACLQNSLSALEVLGKYYLDRRYWRKAIECLKKGSSQGSVVCCGLLADVYYQGNGVTKDVGLALDYLRQAQSLDPEHPLVCYLWGLFYMNGVGVKKDSLKAYQSFLKAFKGDGFVGYVSLGICFQDGIGVDKDCLKAVEFFKMGALLGYCNAQNLLGICYKEGTGVEQSYTEAVKWFRKSAEQGDAGAQYMLGFCYYEGKGVEQSYTEAVKWFRKAAKQGDLDGLYFVGLCYVEGVGVEQSYIEAVKWFRKAAEQGHADAQYNLGYCYYDGLGLEQSYTEAVKWYRKAAEQGDASAQGNLGCCYYSGKGVEQSYTEAAKWFRKAAEQGHAAVQNILGRCYFRGEGVEQSYAEAAKWYRKAAEQGDANAQRNLGVCYDKGHGIEEDNAEAVKWVRKAVEQGNGRAQKVLGDFYKEGRGVEKSLVKALEYYCKSAEDGDEEGQYALGCCYEHGEGCVASMDEAVKWYRKAAKQNYALADDALKRLNVQKDNS